MKKYGFNIQWLFSKEHAGARLNGPDERVLDFMAKHGFNFLRLPTDYRFWTKGTDYLHPDETVFKIIDSFLDACAQRDIQLSLNLHRAPGYCINRNDLETHSLWTDSVAQDAFVFLWETFAKRYAGVPNHHISFDLLNEPPNEGWSMTPDFTRDRHHSLMRRTIAAIRAMDPDREIVIDGLGGGNIAMPELAGLNVIQSCRGYAPFKLTHYKASWANGSDTWPVPTWPLTDGKDIWDRDAIVKFYEPWRAMEALGVKVHVGEFGCFNQTPNDVALAWFADLLDIYKTFGWGFALWGFDYSFGIINHGRPGVRYRDMDGYSVDGELFDMYKAARVQ